MANRRMLSKSISISEQANDLSDFAALLFTWMIPHADDWGVLPGSARKVKALIIPLRPQTADDVEHALAEMVDAELIWRYEVNGQQYIQFRTWERHQEGLHKRSKSHFPLYREVTNLTEDDKPILNASEKDIENHLVDQIRNGSCVITGQEVVCVEQQVRIDNSYIDILCHCKSGLSIIIEVKRQRVSRAAIEQVITYREKMKGNAAVVVIGYGLAAGLINDNSVNIYTYDDNLNITAVHIASVNPCYLTLNNVTESSFLTEENRTEENRTEENLNDDDNARAREEEPIEETPSLDKAKTAEIYAVIEREFGPVRSGLEADFINDLISNFPRDWIIEAIRIAVRNKARNTNYVARILSSWRDKGYSDKDKPWEVDVRGKPISQISAKARNPSKSYSEYNNFEYG